MFDTMMEALADSYRRRILLDLLESDRQQVGHAGDGRDRSDTRRYALAMYHVHLPKLEVEGFIDWDRHRGTVTRGPEFEALRPVLEALETRQAELPADYRETQVCS